MRQNKEIIRQVFLSCFCPRLMQGNLCISGTDLHNPSTLVGKIRETVVDLSVFKDNRPVGLMTFQLQTMID
jgi:hypothetical protein